MKGCSDIFGRVRKMNKESRLCTLLFSNKREEAGNLWREDDTDYGPNLLHCPNLV